HKRDSAMSGRTIAHCAVVLLACGCSRGRAVKPPRAPVTIARAEQRAVPYEITATGTVEPRQTVSIQSQVTGVLTDVAFHEGDDVQTGQVLFHIDARPFQAALEQARAMLDRDAAEALKATVRADSAAVANAELNRAWATVRAPIAGRTGRLLVRPGNLVRANTDALVVINQIH